MTECIKQKRPFEHKIIDKLLRSKYYLGRNIHTSDCDAYLKNKQLCNLIDKIRYEDSDELIRKIKKKLRESKIKIDGGNSDSIYKFYERIDLGNAGCLGAELNIKGCNFRKIDGGNSFEQCTENTLDLGFASSHTATIEFPKCLDHNINGGYSDSSYCPNSSIDFGGAVEQCFIMDQYGNAKITKEYC
jgi:hypothetical protein